jgi:putative peptidoglycan lipid II flippase
VKKTAVILMIITIVAQMVGFLREVTLSYFYGTSFVSDAYLISLTIPETIFAFISAAIATSYIPMYSRISLNKDIDMANAFTSNILNFIFVLSTILIFVGLIFTEQIIKIFASGFEGETLNLAVSFTKISIFGMWFSGLISILSSFLQMKNRFIIVSLMSIPLNISIIFFIWLSEKFNVYYLSYGTVIGLVLQFLLIFPLVYKSGFSYRFILDIHDNYLKKIISLSIPVIIGVSVSQINTIVDRTMASHLSAGSISALSYSNRINALILGLFVATIITVIYPKISKLAAANNLNGLKKSINEAITFIIILVIPTSFGLMFLAQPIVKFIFGRGSFDINSINTTANALFFYSFGLVGWGLREILSRTFYSLQDTKTPMINSAIALILNIMLNILLIKYLGVGGLALATSLTAFISTVMLFIQLRKKIGSFNIYGLLIKTIKVSVASLTMGLIVKKVYTIFMGNLGPNLSLLLTIVCGGIIYFVIIDFLRVKEFEDIKGLIKKRLSNIIHFNNNA